MHFAKILLVLMLSCLELSLKEIEKEKKFCYFLIYQIATTVNAVVIYKVSLTFDLHYYFMGPSINDVTHWGEGDLPKGDVTP